MCTLAFDVVGCLKAKFVFCPLLGGALRCLILASCGSRWRDCCLTWRSDDARAEDPRDSCSRPDPPLGVSAAQSRTGGGCVSGPRSPRPSPPSGSPELYAALATDGAKADDRDMGLEPPRRIVLITHARDAELQEARELVLRLDPDLLAAQDLALVAFDAVR